MMDEEVGLCDAAQSQLVRDIIYRDVRSFSVTEGC